MINSTEDVMKAIPNLQYMIDITFKQNKLYNFLTKYPSISPDAGSTSWLRSTSSVVRFSSELLDAQAHSRIANTIKQLLLIKPMYY